MPSHPLSVPSQSGIQEEEEIIARVAAPDIGKAELLRLADRLSRLGVTRVVMEATADYQ